MSPAAGMFTPRIPVSLLLVLLALGSSLCGCAYQTVSHLTRNPWQVEKGQSLKMNYLVFHYSCSQKRESLAVTGTARIKADTVPDWAVHPRDVWLGAYLCDQRGRILAKDLKIFQTDSLDCSNGFAFAFDLKPQVMGSPGPLFITFGYRLVLTSSAGAEQQETAPSGQRTAGEVFFASESALFY